MLPKNKQQMQYLVWMFAAILAVVGFGVVGNVKKVQAQFPEATITLHWNEATGSSGMADKARVTAAGNQSIERLTIVIDEIPNGATIGGDWGLYYDNVVNLQWEARGCVVLQENLQVDTNLTLHDGCWRSDNRFIVENLHEDEENELSAEGTATVFVRDEILLKNIDLYVDDSASIVSAALDMEGNPNNPPQLAGRPVQSEDFGLKITIFSNVSEACNTSEVFEELWRFDSIVAHTVRAVEICDLPDCEDSTVSVALSPGGLTVLEGVTGDYADVDGRPSWISWDYRYDWLVIMPRLDDLIGYSTRIERGDCAQHLAVGIDPSRPLQTQFDITTLPFKQIVTELPQSAVNQVQFGEGSTAVARVNDNGFYYVRDITQSNTSAIFQLENGTSRVYSVTWPDAGDCSWLLGGQLVRGESYEWSRLCMPITVNSETKVVEHDYVRNFVQIAGGNADADCQGGSYTPSPEDWQLSLEEETISFTVPQTSTLASTNFLSVIENLDPRNPVTCAKKEVTANYNVVDPVTQQLIFLPVVTR